MEKNLDSLMPQRKTSYLYPLLFPNRKHDYLQGVAEYIFLIVQQLGWQFDVAHNKTGS